MLPTVQAILVFAGGELIGLIIFPLVTHSLGPENVRAFDIKSLLKGVLERLVLFIALLNGFPQMLIAFAAMKLGTRLHHEQETEISNIYFLVGNLLSLLLAILDVIITQKLWQP